MSHAAAHNHSPAPAVDLRVSLLGPPELTWKDCPLGLPRRESRALLARLASQEQPVPREDLTFLFWPDAPESQARRSLTYLLANLRRGLPAAQIIRTIDGAISLDWSNCASDAVSFQQLLAGPSPARESAIQLVRGQFLAGFSLPGHSEFEAWAAAERSLLERLYLEALSALVDEYTAAGNYPAALELGRCYLATDELAEPIYRRLIALYALIGDRRSATCEFERCVQILERELNLEPASETRTLYQAVRDARPAADLFTLLGLKPPAQSPMRLAARPRHNLPAPVTSFVGRQSELAYLCQLLHPARGQTRLLTLTGTGGSGKTRLAFEVARELAPEYPDGVWWVDISALTEAGLVALAVASALGITESQDCPIVETLQQSLQPRRLLLLLDNCEHLLQACGQLAEQLLTACPNLVVLATSREAPLGVLERSTTWSPVSRSPILWKVNRVLNLRIPKRSSSSWPGPWRRAAASV